MLGHIRPVVYSAKLGTKLGLLLCSLAVGVMVVQFFGFAVLLIDSSMVRESGIRLVL